MKDIDLKQNGIFKYLQPEEIDEMIREKINKIRTDKKRVSDKWTDTELLYRRQVIFELIRKGYSRQRIQEELMSRWECVKRSAQRYVKDALEALEEDNKDFIIKTRDIQRERIESVIEKAMNSNNFEAALKGLEQINKIDGLYNEKITANIKAEGIKFQFGIEPDNHEN